METLGLSDSTPRSESRLKSLLWPSVANATDVDYLGSQGYWLCTIIAVATLIVCLATGQAVLGVVVLLYYYLGGAGVREGSRYAAIAVFVLYVEGIIISGVSVMNILFAALLLSNVRATWIASRWKPESEEAAPPPRLNETFGDKFADQLPRWLWPKVRVLYYIFSAAILILAAIGIPYMMHQRTSGH
jgi:hypothetical protein